jgi:anti-sigma factor (TIGR02949 family)
VNCDDLAHRLDAYVDGELTPAATMAIGCHVRNCPDCRRQVALIDIASALVRRAPRYPMPPDVRARVARRVAQAARIDPG